jgi:hypothetical protein
MDPTPSLSTRSKTKPPESRIPVSGLGLFIVMAARFQNQVRLRSMLAFLLPALIAANFQEKAHSQYPPATSPTSSLNGGAGAGKAHREPAVQSEPARPAGLRVGVRSDGSRLACGVHSSGFARGADRSSPSIAGLIPPHPTSDRNEPEPKAGKGVRFAAISDGRCRRQGGAMQRNRLG